MIQLKPKRTFPILGTVGILLAVVLALNLGSAPTVEGSVSIRCTLTNLQASWVGTNTRIEAISIYDNITFENYTFTADGETILNVPEGTNLSRIYIWYHIDDNYASSTTEAKSRGRVRITITDPDSVVQYNDNISILNATSALALDKGTYYEVALRLDYSIATATVGTWDLTAEYEVFMIPP